MNAMLSNQKILRQSLLELLEEEFEGLLANEQDVEINQSVDQDGLPTWYVFDPVTGRSQMTSDQGLLDYLQA